jgi:hypothetical protein
LEHFLGDERHKALEFGFLKLAEAGADCEWDFPVEINGAGRGWISNYLVVKKRVQFRGGSG